MRKASQDRAVRIASKGERRPAVASREMNEPLPPPVPSRIEIQHGDAVSMLFPEISQPTSYVAPWRNKQERLNNHYPYPPRTWLAWSFPGKYLSSTVETPAIDKAVADLIGNDSVYKSAHPRTKAQLLTLGISCPYYFARYSVALAVDSANREFAWSDGFKNAIGPKLRKMEKKGAALAAALRAFYDDCDEFGTSLIQRRHLTDACEAKTFYSYLDQLNVSMRSIDQLTVQLKQDRRAETVNGHPSDTWGIAFASSIANIWGVLTRDAPSSSSDMFKDFLAAAYESVGGETRDWTSQIRSGIKRDGKYDIWDLLFRLNLETRPDLVVKRLIKAADNKYMYFRHYEIIIEKYVEVLTLARQSDKENLDRVNAIAVSNDRRRHDLLELAGWRASDLSLLRKPTPRDAVL